jgi:peptidoglycan hydrolase-like protein with peptidoglycan-binding domain
MSSPSYTPSQQAPDQQTPHQQGGGPSWFRVWTIVIGTAVVGALVALAVVLSQSHSSPAPATTPTSASAPAQSTGNPTTPAHPTGTPTTAVKPSAAVEKLQQELGQLNYYNGPADGIMGPQTVQAIKYLQRDAHLPQTGQMNAATQAALANFLAHGNNHMGG